MNVCDLRVGSKIVFGAYAGEDIVWQKVSAGNDFFAVSRVSRKRYDRQERMSDSRARRSHGNNFYPHSNIHQWLNAVECDWFEMKHQYDEMPDYADQYGFLTEFSKAERDALIEREFTVNVPLGSRKEFGKQITMKALVSLPSAAEVMEDIPEAQGEADYNPEMRSVLENAVRWSAVMSRTWAKDAGHIYICGNGWAESSCANASMDVHPIIRLRSDVQFSDSPDRDGVYWSCLGGAESADDFMTFITE